MTTGKNIMSNTLLSHERNDMDNISFYSAGDESLEESNMSLRSVGSVVEVTPENVVLNEIGAGDGKKNTFNVDPAKNSQDLISSESNRTSDVSSKRKREPSPDVEIRSEERMEDSEDSLMEDGDTSVEGIPIIWPQSDPDGDLGKKASENIDDNLPETVTLLRTPDGAKVYLVGTAHFSLESKEDVAKVIQAVQPHVVLVELCKARVNILQLDENTILEEAKNINFEKIYSTIKQNGLFNGLVYILLLSMSAHITKQLGMAPGGDFRRAFSEAKRIPPCIVHLGDRPIHITLQRALSSLSWWQTIKVTWHLLMSRDPISKEEVERCKQKDLLEEMLYEMMGEFPALSNVFVKERDIYLTHSLHLAAAVSAPFEGYLPARVVGVVGMGHVPGIVQHWGKVKPEDIPPLLYIPPPSVMSRVVRTGAKVSVLGLILWGCYRILPLPKSLPNLSSLKTSIQGVLHQ